MRTGLVAALALSTTLCVSQTQAGVFTDDLGRCLIGKLTGDDKVILVRWLTVVYAAHPALVGIATIDASKVEAIDQSMAGMFMRLMTVDCVDAARTAIQNEGVGAIGASFGVLGQSAGAELMVDPAVGAAGMRFGSHLDNAELQRVFPEIQ